MAAKRFLEESGIDLDQPTGKRTKSKPSFASVIGEVLMVNFLQNFCSTLEPMLRRVVSEEVERGIRKGAKSLIKSPSLRIQASEAPSLQLVFGKKLSLPIFTGTKISDADGDPLQIFLVDSKGNRMLSTSLSRPLKVEIVVLDGDFPPGDQETWTANEFDKHIVKERAGKRPLLTGDLMVTIRDGYAVIVDIEFTDNSSWIRSRRFRIGARVVQGSGQAVRVREAMTESFVVKDHRGELYKKHHPPTLDDEVWRLEKIGKDGAFHKKLSEMGIKTVQDFLKLSVVDPTKLRKILGVGMSEKMWEVTIKHARTCLMGNKLYILRGPTDFLLLNPVCQVVKAVINGQTYLAKDLLNAMNRAYLENLMRDAYENWNSLEEVDGIVNGTPLLTQGDQVEEYTDHPLQSMPRSNYQQHAFLTDGSVQEVAGSAPAGNANLECTDQWLVSAHYYASPPETGTAAIYHFSESSSDGDDQTPARSFFHEG